MLMPPCKKEKKKKKNNVLDTPRKTPLTNEKTKNGRIKGRTTKWYHHSSMVWYHILVAQTHMHTHTRTHTIWNLQIKIKIIIIIIILINVYHKPV
jgi:hypothetical protein